MIKEIKWDSLTQTETQTLQDLKMSNTEIYTAPIELNHKNCQIPVRNKSLIMCLECKHCSEYLYSKYWNNHKVTIISFDNLIESGYDVELNRRATNQHQTMLEYEEMHNLMNVKNSLIIQVFETKEESGYSMFNLEILMSLIIAVIANVISHLICKWLDKNKK